MGDGEIPRGLVELAGAACLLNPRRGQLTEEGRLSTPTQAGTAVRCGAVAHFHHANLSVLEGGVEAETQWLVEILGYRQIEVAPDWPKSGPYWFEADDGSQIHLSVDPEHRPAARAHLAIAFQELEPIRERLDAAGEQYELGGRGPVGVLLCRDPAGNRWELRSDLA